MGTGSILKLVDRALGEVLICQGEKEPSLSIKVFTLYFLLSPCHPRELDEGATSDSSRETSASIDASDSTEARIDCFSS